jgi:hypothetical protein
MSEPFERAIAMIDALHAQDPERELGEPAELVYARRMTDALMRLQSAPSQALQLAVRAQHLCRWRMPRADHPAGKAGYLRWRIEQGKRHASLASETLRAAGCDETTIAKVADLIRKKDAARDPEAHALEDAACLVFLEHHFDGFARERDDAQLVEIVAKTWKKMSERGRELALGLPLSERARSIVASALGRAR